MGGNYNNNWNRNSKGYEKPAALPVGYLQGGYYSDPGKIRLKKEYIVDYPREIADALDRDGGRDANKRTQIRKFYEYLLRVERKMSLAGNDFSVVEADIAGLLPHVSYAGKRRLVSSLFVEFTEKNIAAVRDEKDMRAFVKHFEALVAFTKKD